MRARLFLFALFVTSLVSCATWDAPQETMMLPPPQLPADGVVLEIEFVRVPAGMEAEAEQLWKEVDEQHVPSDQRRVLEANGLRTGLVGSQIPLVLRGWLDAKKPVLEQIAEGTLPQGSDLFLNRQRLQCRTGSRKKIVAAPQKSGATVVILNEEGQLVGEPPFDEAQGMFLVTTYPHGDGRVRVLLTPLIEHGEAKQRFVPTPGMISVQLGREQREFDQLQIDSVVSPGQTILVTCTPHTRGLGGLFFSDAVGPGDRSLMLVRLARSQYDDLFSADRNVSPLVTPIE